MSDLDASRLIAAGFYLLPTLVWGSMVPVAWRNAVLRRPRALLALMTALTASATLYYGIGGLLRLLPPSAGAPGTLSTLRDLLVIAIVACFQHLVPLSPAHGRAPARGALVRAYGLAALVAGIVAFPQVLPGPAEHRWLASRGILLAYYMATGAIAHVRLIRLARRGPWRRGGMGEASSADVAMGIAGFAFAAGMVIRWTAGESATAPLWVAAAESAIGLLNAVPYAVRLLAEGARVFLGATVLVAAAVGMRAGVQTLVPAGVERDLVSVLGLVVVLVPGRALVRWAVDGLVYRRSRRRHTELQAILRSLSPELGVLECCRRALAAGMGVMQLRGAAIILQDGEALVEGTFALDPVRSVWPRGEAARALPARAFGGPQFRLLPPPLAEAMTVAEVVGVLPIVSPRRRWGDLFATASMLRPIYSEEDVRAWEGFADQLALVLDAADLIARAVAVERSLLHAEKLAAVGEVSARIAHEIRNPVAAARSLAQQLAREPGSPVAAELGVILEELERVERQVGALLRFARREELCFEAVDLGELVRRTVGALRGRLDAAGVEVALDAPEGVTARADREKIRQVLVNLVENAIDALGATAGRRSLAIAVAGANGVAKLRIADSGPGVPADALPHLFEPFFSLKPTGTGLGLAIAKRTVEAHGGRIEARGGDGTGMTFALELPSAERTA